MKMTIDFMRPIENVLPYIVVIEEKHLVSKVKRPLLKYVLLCLIVRI